MLRLAVLASGSGSNFQSIFDAAANHRLGRFKPVLLVSDRVCRAVDRARDAGVDSVVLDRRIHGGRLSQALGNLLNDFEIDFVALAGWLSILDASITEEWKGRMVNIHPSLLPSYGGPGMYGRRVHQAVLDAGEKESGCSIHYVTAGVDEGTVLGRRSVPVADRDTAESLAARILVEEHRLYPEILAGLSESLNKYRSLR